MKLRKIASLFMVAVLGLSVVGCGKIDKTLPNYSSDEQFRFAAYISPPPAGIGSGTLANNPNYITVKDYQIMKDCGFNYAYSGYLRNEQDVISALDVAQQVGGIKYLVRDDADINAMIYDVNKTADWDLHKLNVEDKWAKYAEYESFGGAMAIDEPSEKLFENIAEVKDWYSEKYPNLEYNTNLLPSWASAAQLGSTDYESHLSSFIKTVKPTQISYDYYPFVDRNGKQTFFKTEYFSNLEAIAYTAKENDIPFFVYLLTHPHLNYSEMTHYSDIAWQVYNAMTFGCTGAQTFTYWTLMQDGQTAVVDSYGRPTACYYAIQEVISEVRAMEDVYMNFDWQGTMAYIADEDKPNVHLRAMNRTLKSHDKIQSYSSNEDIIIGTFKDKDGKDGFMVTNVTLPADRKTATVNITFSDAKQAAIYAKGKSFVRGLNKNTLTLEIGAGEGWFIIPS